MRKFNEYLRTILQFSTLSLVVTSPLACDGKETDKATGTTVFSGDGDGDSDDTPASSLIGDYIADTIEENGEDVVLVSETNLHISFKAPYDDVAWMSASASCNSLQAGYELVDSRLILKDGSSTEKGCETGIFEQEEWYFAFLGSEPELAIDGDRISLTNDAIHIEYLDREVAIPDLELVGPVWEVTGILDGGGVSNSAWEESATFEFEENGSVKVFTGCNSGGGSYTVEGNTVTLSGLEITEEGCPGVQGRLEEDVLMVWNASGPFEWEIDESQLNFENGDVGLYFNALK